VFVDGLARWEAGLVERGEDSPEVAAGVRSDVAVPAGVDEHRSLGVG
jgi:hypothetical protein